MNYTLLLALLILCIHSHTMNNSHIVKWPVIVWWGTAALLLLSTFGLVAPTLVVWLASINFIVHAVLTYFKK